MHWNDQITLDVLMDPDQDVMVFKATELIQKLGLQGQLKEKILRGAQDEWTALEWIPTEMIVGLNLC